MSDLANVLELLSSFGRTLKALRRPLSKQALQCHPVISICGIPIVSESLV